MASCQSQAAVNTAFATWLATAMYCFQLPGSRLRATGGLFVWLGAVAATGQGQAQQCHERQRAQARGEGSRHADLPMMTVYMLRQTLPGRLLIPVGRV